MEKRYQVFVSSTYTDLIEERQEVMNALLELGCIPSGMELFPAANESQWSLIKRVIDDCDYYVLIMGGRYGSLGPDGFSYTDMEYRYALSVNKPTIAFLHGDPGKIQNDKTEQTTEGKEKLAVFRKLVQDKLCKTWSSPADLGSVVSRSLIQLIRQSPAIGWVRANELADKDAALELLKLRSRVEELQTELDLARTTAPPGAEGLAQGEDTFSIRFSYPSESGQLDFEWNDLFSLIAPLMINEATDAVLKRTLKDAVMSDARGEGHELNAVPAYSFSINDEDFQTIKVQLRALGLIARSQRQRSLKDTETYWTLTRYGDEVMTRLKAIPKASTV